MFKVPCKSIVLLRDNPLNDADLPHTELAAPPLASQEDWSDEAKMSRKLLAGLPAYSIHYDEGVQVGYRWYDQQHKAVLFPFGFGLSYSSFTYSALKVEGGETIRVTFTVKTSAPEPDTRLRRCTPVCLLERASHFGA